MRSANDVGVVVAVWKICNATDDTWAREFVRRRLDLMMMMMSQHLEVVVQMSHGATGRRFDLMMMMSQHLEEVVVQMSLDLSVLGHPEGEGLPRQQGSCSG